MLNDVFVLKDSCKNRKDKPKALILFPENLIELAIDNKISSI
jgi:hypothetical protein